MKPEWITDNVKRACAAFAKYNVPSVKAPTVAITNLEEALDLLHFAAERSNVSAHVEWNPVRSSRADEEGHPLRTRRELSWWVTSRDNETGGAIAAYGPGNSESLLHAVLLAIDAIVAAKPEAFA